MLADVAHNFISSDPVVYAGTLGAILLTWGSIWAFVIHPRAQEHKKHEAERFALKKELDDRENLRHQFIDGIPEFPGMTFAVKPAAVRMREAENRLDLLELEANK
jgi:hypothetical protein